MANALLILRSILSRAMWIATAASAAVGAMELYNVALNAESAPQQAAAYATIPYVVARALDQVTRPSLE